jgi:hypothetical protein
LISFALILTVSSFCGAASGEVYTVGGTWLIEGEGTARKDMLPVKLYADGTLQIKSATENGSESILGYEIWGDLEASHLGINAWEDRGKYEVPSEFPIPPINDFNPSMSDPIKLPPFEIDHLVYTVEFTSVHSGTVNISGYVILDVVNRTEISANCAIWRQGTPKPDTPDTSWGCDAGAGAASLVSLAMLGSALRRRKRRA